MRKAVLLAALCVAFGWEAATAPNQIAVPADASPLVKFAAAEARRYIYVRTGQLLPIAEGENIKSDTIVVGSKTYLPAAQPRQDAGDAPWDKARAEQGYVIKTVPHGAHRLVVIAGSSDVATLYAAYRFAELLGVRFYLHGDVVPDERMPWQLPDFDVEESPLFATRGIQPFHDFPEGPDWWNLDDYKAIIGQLPKLRMNFIGLHTYPEDRPNAEPTVWIGRPEDVREHGRVAHGYPAIYYNTALPVGWGLSPKATSAYPAGAAALYDRDDFGPDIMRGLSPRPDTPEECLEVFDRAGAMFRDAFTFARFLGVKTCIGTETPLTVPRAVREQFPSGPNTFEVIGGKTASYQDPIEGTELDALYQSVRYDLEGYAIALPQGSYAVTLHFCEVAYGTVGARVFGVTLEGLTAIDSLDIYARAGKDAALDVPFENVRVADGVLNIDFIQQVEYPAIAGISVAGQGAEVYIDCGGPGVGPFAGDDGNAPLEPAAVQELYAGIFKRIMAAHPLDYYWFWTPEGWTWEGAQSDQVKNTIADIQLAIAAAKEVNAPFQLATCGWVLGPQDDRALFGRVLPPGMPVSCISRSVGHAPLEPGFAEVQNREKWAIPWLEDDPAMVSPQLWVGRMRRDACDALRYGCTGLLGIHWRTRILGPNVSALAKAAWDQEPWAMDLEGGRRAKGGEAGADAGLPRDFPAADFYEDWAAASFGPQSAAAVAAVFARIDGKLPRPSDWVGGPGGFNPDSRPWETVAQEYAFLDELEALRGKVAGAGNLERFDYWLNTFRYMRESDRMRGLWHRSTQAIDKTEKAASKEEQARIARDEALPAYRGLAACIRDMYTYLLASVSTSGGMGNFTNLEQHSMPQILYGPGEKLAGLLGEPLPADALLDQQYRGPDRVFVRTVRTCIFASEPLTVSATVLAAQAPQAVALLSRPLGEGPFEEQPMQHVARGIYAATVPPGAREQDFEYCVRATLNDGKTLVWPPTAPGLCQTVVVAP